MPSVRSRIGTVGREHDPVGQPTFDARAAQACEAELAASGVRFEVLPEIDEAECGYPRPLAVSVIGEVVLRPAAVLQCPVARALVDWIGMVMVPSARVYLDGDRVTGLVVAGSYQCRDRSGRGGELSEHAHANAVDVAGLTLENRGTLPIRVRLEPDDGAMEFQAAVRGGACAYFTTVIGPGTDPDRSDHLHLDLSERTGGYRLCQ